MIGKTVGKYKIEETLGGSPTSQVYKATDTQTNKPVALKVLHSHVKTPETLERFRREAKLLLPLKHKNIVSVIDYFTDDEDNPIVVLEFVSGENLRRIIDKEKKILPDIALMIIREVALGLKQAHYEKIVHRDLKPENILITGEGNVKLSDFGLAHFFEAEGLTKPGTQIGTPVFMSPEQIKGMPVDARSDIFSLGIIFYLLVSGQYPFNGATKKEVFEAVLNKDPIPLNEFVPNVPFGIMRFIDRCLEKELDTRYQSIDQLLHDVDSYMSYYGMQEYDGYLHEYLKDPAEGDEQIKKFITDSTIKSGFKFYYLRDNEAVIRFFKKLTDIKGLTDESIDTVIRKKKRSQGKEKVYAIVGAILLAVLAFFAGRLTKSPLILKEFKKEEVRVSPQVKQTAQAMQLQDKRGVEATAPAETAPPKTRPKKAESVPPKTVMKSAPVQRTREAQSAGTGELKIIVDPWAYVYIDGKYYGKAPMYDSIVLSAGQHNLQLKNPECEEVDTTFTVSKNEVVTKEITLVYKPTRIRINVPEGASLYVDDQLVDLNDESHPFEFVHGKHELRVEKTGYQIYRKEIEIIGGKDLMLNVELKKLK